MGKWVNILVIRGIGGLGNGEWEQYLGIRGLERWGMGMRENVRV